jgi:hypothetical protein
MNPQARSFTDRFAKEIGRPARSGDLSTPRLGSADYEKSHCPTYGTDLA